MLSLVFQARQHLKVSLVGDLLSAYPFDKSTFNPPEGNTSAANLYVELRFTCLDESGGVLDVSRAVAEPRVSVSREAVRVNGSVGGEGEVVVE